MQVLRLVDFLQERGALFQHLGSDPAQVHHQFALRGRQYAGHGVEQTQSADARAMRGGQRDAGVMADARPAGDQWIGGEQRILARVGDLHQRIAFDGMRAEGDIPRRFAGIRQADVGLEPLPVLGNDGNQAHRHAGGGLRRGYDCIEDGFGRSV